MSENFDAWTERFLQRLERSKIATPSDLEGCSTEELAHLESQYKVDLPTTYRWYLSVMGKSTGRLFSHDHTIASDGIPLTTSWWREELSESGSTFVPPKNALLIAQHLGEQFNYILCDNSDDSPVWHFAEEDDEPKQVFPSVTAWLEAWAGEAEKAIQSGYFDR